MKKNIMPLENKMLFYVIVVIAILNVIAYLSVKDWNSLIFFFLAGFVAHAFQLGKTLSLIVAILSANIFRATKIMREGLETKKKQKAVPKPNEKKTDFADADDDEDDKQHSTETLEGLTKSAHKLMDRQQSLQAMTNQLEPMMKQAMQMMNQLPKDFLKKNMKNNSNT
jgi:parvulin-like peptidyl-prolyl isomerase